METWADIGGDQYFSRGLDNVLSHKTDWKVVQTPFLFQKGQRPDKVTLTILINGKGSVWIDNVVLSKEPLKQRSKPTTAGDRLKQHLSCNVVSKKGEKYNES